VLDGGDLHKSNAKYLCSGALCVGTNDGYYAHEKLLPQSSCKKIKNGKNGNSVPVSCAEAELVATDAYGAVLGKKCHKITAIGPPAACCEH
jgi:hypothetical protein